MSSNNLFPYFQFPRKERIGRRDECNVTWRRGDSIAIFRTVWVNGTVKVNKDLSPSTTTTSRNFNYGTTEPTWQESIFSTKFQYESIGHQLNSHVVLVQVYVLVKTTWGREDLMFQAPGLFDNYFIYWKCDKPPYNPIYKAKWSKYPISVELIAHRLGYAECWEPLCMDNSVQFQG